MSSDGRSTALAEAVARAKQVGDPNALVGQIPYARFLGVRAEVHSAGLLFRMSFSEHLVGDPRLPALHGGTLGALLESAALLQTLWDAPAELPKTITLTIEYLRSARTVDTFADAEIERSGRRVVVMRARAWQTSRDEPVAAATVHLLRPTTR